MAAANDTSSDISNLSDRSHGALETSQYDEQDIAHIITFYVIISLASVGLVFNSFAFWVWGAEREFKPLAFFIKCLAVCDNVFLLTFTGYLFVQPLDILWLKEVSTFIFITALYTTVCLTTCISVTLYTCVVHPITARRCFTPSCVRISACVYILLILSYRLLITTLKYLHIRNKTTMHAIAGTITVVFAIAPTLLQAILVGRIMLRKSSRVVQPQNEVDEEHHNQAEPAGSRKPSKPFCRDGRLLGITQRELTHAVLYIILVSIIPFGIMTSIILVRVFLPHDEHRETWTIFNLLRRVLVVLNSSVNFLIYYLVIPKFRALFHAKLRSLSRARGTQKQGKGMATTLDAKDPNAKIPATDYRHSYVPLAKEDRHWQPS